MREEETENESESEGRILVHSGMPSFISVTSLYSRAVFFFSLFLLHSLFSFFPFHHPPSPLPLPPFPPVDLFLSCLRSSRTSIFLSFLRADFLLKALYFR